MRSTCASGSWKIRSRSIAKTLPCGETLRIFGDPDGFYVKSEPLFNRGNLARAIFGALRESPDGLDRYVIAEAVAKANDIDMTDDALAFLVRKRVNDALYRYLHKGVNPIYCLYFQ
jgi:hypothetical protein